MSLRLQMQSSSACVIKPLPVKRLIHSPFPALISRRCTAAMASVSGNGTPVPPTSKSAAVLKSNDLSATQCLVSSPIEPVRPLGFRTTPELGLLSLLFVLSIAIGSVVSLGVISVPTMLAFRRLGNSAENLSKVVMEEVPGTLSSLKLSGLEINELTDQLSNLRYLEAGMERMAEAVKKPVPIEEVVDRHPLQLEL